MLRLPGFHKSKNTARIAITDKVIRQFSPREVYCSLLWYADFMKWKPGWAAYAFKEIYGGFPRNSDQGEPICCIGTSIEKWIAQRPKKAKKK